MVVGRRYENLAMTKQDVRECGEGDPVDYGSRWLPETCGIEGDASG